jgi:predicted Rossmann fold flavoprotein
MGDTGPMESHDAIILGAGAAGCMAAIQAGRRGRKVLLVDGGKRVGGKIPISGGGRCNFTNRGAKAENFVSANPDFCRSALARYGPADVEAWFKEAGITYYEKKLGQLFCDGSAMVVVDLLEKELKEAGVTLQMNSRVEGLEKKGGGFRAWGPGWEAEAPAAVVALGGPSYPALGASDLGFILGEQFGLPVVPTASALDGFTFHPKDLELYKDLPGVALDVTLTCGGKTFSEALLFTHRGLSGPAALQGSLYWQPGQEVQVDLWPGQDAAEGLLRYKLGHKDLLAADWLFTRWPRSMAACWQQFDPGRFDTLGRRSDAKLREFAAKIQPWRFTPAGTTGPHKAEVTRGGVDTRQLSQKNMEARAVKGLYFIGEAVDVTGQLGGYNFQWAWSSGHACGSAL